MRALSCRDIVCFSNDWDGDPLSKTHIMRILARENHVLWVNSLGHRSPRATRRDALRAVKKIRAAAGGLRCVERGLHVLAPLYVPVFGAAAIRAASAMFVRFQLLRAMSQLGMRRPISWSFLPSAAPVAGTIGEDFVIYHVVDEFAAFSDASAQVPAMERELLNKADLVLTSSEKLLASKSQLHPRTRLVRHGVDHTHFARALDPATPVPEDLARLPRPIVGFFGLIADWIDLELVRTVADAFPSASVVLLGEAVTSLAPLAGARNVHLLGRRHYGQLPGYCRGFDVALTPFRLNDLTRSANPLKAREYVAAGLPNVCTDVPELRSVPGCIVARTPAEFVARVGSALGDGGPRQERSDLVRDESWEARVDEIRAHVAAFLDGRRAA
jgi:glycosyltransferase involved in cell wall biosynthesis